MDIVNEQQGARLLVKITGRIDGFWSDHLTRQLEALVRSGQHDLLLDLSAVDFISSAGVRVLVAAHRQLKAVEGRFGLTRPSAPVRTVLEMIGLKELFSLDVALPAAPVPAATAPAVAESPKLADAEAQHLVGEFSRGATQFEEYRLAGSTMSARLQGTPGRLLDGRFAASDCAAIALPAGTVALGLGAFGTGFEACRDFFGEFIAVDGAAACQPGNGAMSCDYLLAQGQYIPEVQSLYSITCSGPFSRLLRFDADDHQTPTTLAALAREALNASGGSVACLVIVAESAGLIGAGLRRSPLSGSTEDTLFAFPGVRDRLSFSTERLDAGSTVVAAGIVADLDHTPEALKPFVRSLGAGTGLLGHVHASSFRYRPLPKGLIEIGQVIRPLFEGESARGVMHLLCDDRDPQRVEDSAFIRGACWTASLNIER